MLSMLWYSLTLLSAVPFMLYLLLQCAGMQSGLLTLEHVHHRHHPKRLQYPAYILHSRTRLRFSIVPPNYLCIGFWSLSSSCMLSFWSRSKSFSNTKNYLKERASSWRDKLSLPSHHPKNHTVFENHWKSPILVSRLVLLSLAKMRYFW